MNTFQQTLYTNLLNLVDSNEAFYYQDFYLEPRWYRIFNYRLASYTDFLQPGAIECRGVMFEVDTDSRDANPIRLAALPMEKFFNVNENPMTTDLDLSTVVEIMTKVDGSLMSTYLHYNAEGVASLRLKSKGSLFSDQALAAMQWLKTQPILEGVLYKLAIMGWTVNMEWCAPQHRIVIGYETPHLKVLNARNTYTGEYLIHRYLVSHFGTALIPDLLYADNPAEFVRQVPDMTGTEGFVIRLASGQRAKIKTVWYLTQHRAKDSINSDRRLYEAVLAESTDDLRSLFYDDPLVIKRIETMELFVEKIYNHLVASVESFYEANKDLDRKSYAILGQEQLSRDQFGLAMMKYVGKPVDYKGYMVKKWKDYGVKDDTLAEE